MKKCKAKGVVLLEAFLALMLMAMASYGLAAVNSVQFSQLAASRDAILAKNYAELEAQYLKQLGYDEVVDDNYDIDDPGRRPRYPDGKNADVDRASNARNMNKFLGDTLGAQWRSTATLGESVDNIGGDEDNRIQNVIVSVYKTSDGIDASPRATVTVPLSTQGGNRVPVGGIIAWPRNSNPSTSSNIWLECNGQTFDTNRFKKLYKALGSNRVPDFRGMFLRGYGSQSYTQENGRRNNSGGYQEGSTTTVHSSGSVGSIQGDAVRADAWGIEGVFHTGESDFGGYGGGWKLYTSNSNFWGSGIYAPLAEGDIHYMVYPKHYRYRPIVETITIPGGEDGSGGGSFTAVTGLEEYTSPVEADESAVVHTMISNIAGGSLYTSHNANEIRPVNVAVCFYIRAK